MGRQQTWITLVRTQWAGDVPSMSRLSAVCLFSHLQAKCVLGTDPHIQFDPLKLLIKFAISPGHIILTSSQPVLALSPKHQAPGWITMRVQMSKSQLVWLSHDFKGLKTRAVCLKLAIVHFCCKLLKFVKTCLNKLQLIFKKNTTEIWQKSLEHHLDIWKLKLIKAKTNKGHFATNSSNFNP